MLHNSLLQFGLTEKEASIYIMLLRIGSSPVSALSRRLKIKRATTYGVLESLVRRGYVVSFKGEHCREYKAKSPECILDELKRKDTELHAQINLAQECISRLQAMCSAPVQSTCTACGK
jgi:sugar-specific transcriptional regulator TrmB